MGIVAFIVCLLLFEMDFIWCIIIGLLVNAMDDD